MKKIHYIVLGLVLGSSIMFGLKAFAWEPPISYRDLSFKLTNGSGIPLWRIQDPDNGNICYISPSYGSSANNIFCISTE